MLRYRIIPCLLLRNKGLVKGLKFKDHRYVGDPINAVQIFNSKEVDEIIFLDITATAENRIPDLALIQRIADQCLVPFAVGGGIRSLDDAQKVLSNGAEKVCLNTAAFEDPSVITKIANNFGIQSVVVTLDVKKNLFGKYELYTRCGTSKRKESLVDAARMMADAGAGEIVVNAIDLDGTRKGYDTNLLKLISDAVTVPVIALGGAGCNEDFEKAIHEGGVGAASAGSLFVFHGRREAVLISYLNDEDHKRITKGGK